MPTIVHDLKSMVSDLNSKIAALESKQGEIRSALGRNVSVEVNSAALQQVTKSLIAARALEPGEIITEDAVAARSPGRGVQPNRRKQLVGRRAKRRLEPGDFFPSRLVELVLFCDAQTSSSKIETDCSTVACI